MYYVKKQANNTAKRLFYEEKIAEMIDAINEEKLTPEQIEYFRNKIRLYSNKIRLIDSISKEFKNKNEPQHSA